LQFTCRELRKQDEGAQSDPKVKGDAQGKLEMEHKFRDVRACGRLLIHWFYLVFGMHRSKTLGAVTSEGHGFVICPADAQGNEEYKGWCRYRKR